MLYLDWDEETELDELWWRDEEEQAQSASREAAMDIESHTLSVLSFPLVQQMALCIDQPCPGEPDCEMCAVFVAPECDTATTAAIAQYAHLHSLHIVGINYGMGWGNHGTGQRDEVPCPLLPPFFAPLLLLPSLRTLHPHHRAGRRRLSRLHRLAGLLPVGQPAAHLP